MGSGVSTLDNNNKNINNEFFSILLFNKIKQEYNHMIHEKNTNETIFYTIKQILIDNYIKNNNIKDINKESNTHRDSLTNDLKKKRMNIFSKGYDITSRNDMDKNTPRNDKSMECTLLLKKALELLLFEKSSKEEIDLVLNIMQRIEINENINVIYQGETGDTFYVVEEGLLEFIVNDVVVGTVQEGGSFGELALIYDAPRAATVRTVKKSILWTLEREEFRNIQARTSCDTLLKRATWLEKVPLLNTLSRRQISLLATAFESIEYKNDDIIIKQGDIGHSFYILEQGIVTCMIQNNRISSRTNSRCLSFSSNSNSNSNSNFTLSTNHLPNINTELTRLQVGDYFGETALLKDQPRNANIIAVGNVKCLKLDRKDFNTILGSLNTLLDLNANKRIFKIFKKFEHLNDIQLNHLITLLESVQYKDKDIIYNTNNNINTNLLKEDINSNGFYIIKHGSVQLTEYVKDKDKDINETNDNNIYILNQLNDYFGMELFDETIYNFHSYKAIAIGDVTCVRLTYSILKEFEKNINTNELSKTNTSEDSNKNIKTTKNNNIYSSIRFEDLIHIGVLGEGSFGKVSMVQIYLNDKENLLALKSMSKAHLIECKQEIHVLREKEILYDLYDHPFIVQLYNTHQDNDYLYMLMELVQGGEFFNLLHNDINDKLDINSIQFYAANVYLALEHLHKKDYAYRDLKPENLLLDTNGYLKLVDFGFAKKIPYTILCEDGKEEFHSRSYTLCGTQEYLAPEFVLNIGHDIAVDHWAFGILIYEMLFGYTPFETDDGDIGTLFKNIAYVRTGMNKVQFPNDILIKYPNICNFISKLLHGDPTKRLGIGMNGSNEIRNHLFFKSIEWNDLYNKKIKSPYKPIISGKYDLSCFEGDQGLRLNDTKLSIHNIKDNPFKDF